MVSTMPCRGCPGDPARPRQGAAEHFTPYDGCDNNRSSWHASSCGTGRVRPRSRRWCRRGCACTASCAAGPLGRAHARSRDRVAIAAYLDAGPTSKGHRAFARAYVDPDENDPRRWWRRSAPGGSRPKAASRSARGQRMLMLRRPQSWEASTAKSAAAHAEVHVDRPDVVLDGVHRHGQVEGDLFERRHRGGAARTRGCRGSRHHPRRVTRGSRSPRKILTKAHRSEAR